MSTTASPSIGDLLVALRRSWFAVALLVAVAAGAGYVVTDRSGTEHTASVQLTVASGDALVGVFGQAVPGAAIAAADVALLAESTVVAARAADALDVSIDELGTVRADVSDDRVAPTVTITVRTAAEAIAVDGANAIAAATIAAHGAGVDRALADAIAALETSVAARDADVAALDAQLVTATAAELRTLESQRALVADSAQQLRRRLDELRVEREAVRSPIAVAVAATDASTASAAPADVALLAGVLALLLGGAVSYLRLSYARAALARRDADADLVGLGDADEPATRPWGRRDIG